MRRLLVARVVNHAHAVHEIAVCKLLHRLGRLARAALDLRESSKDPTSGSPKRRHEAQTCSAEQKRSGPHMVSPRMSPSLLCTLQCPLLHDVLVRKDEEDLEVEPFVPVLLHDLLEPPVDIGEDTKRSAKRGWSGTICWV